MCELHCISLRNFITLYVQCVNMNYAYVNMCYICTFCTDLARWRSSTLTLAVREIFFLHTRIRRGGGLVGIPLAISLLIELELLKKASVFSALRQSEWRPCLMF